MVEIWLPNHPTKEVALAVVEMIEVVEASEGGGQEFPKIGVRSEERKVGWMDGWPVAFCPDKSDRQCDKNRRNRAWWRGSTAISVCMSALRWAKEFSVPLRWEKKERMNRAT